MNPPRLPQDSAARSRETINGLVERIAEAINEAPDWVEFMAFSAGRCSSPQVQIDYASFARVFAGERVGRSLFEGNYHYQAARSGVEWVAVEHCSEVLDAITLPPAAHAALDEDETDPWPENSPRCTRCGRELVPVWRNDGCTATPCPEHPDADVTYADEADLELRAESEATP